MVKNMNNETKFEIVTKMAKFFFYEDYFVYYWRSKVKKARTVYYKDVIKIDCFTQIYSFMRFFTYAFTIKDQKPFGVAALTKRLFKRVTEAVEYIQERRMECIVNEITRLENEKQIES